MPGFKVKVLADSISPDGVRVTSVAYQAPRTTLAETNTHRVISKLAESSRAIPFATRLRLTRERPYVPGDLPDGELMGENPGMQATAAMDPAKKAEGQKLFAELAAVTADYCERISALGFHKQDVNRADGAVQLDPRRVDRDPTGRTYFALRTNDLPYPPLRFLAAASTWRWSGPRRRRSSGRLAPAVHHPGRPG
jgi:hypothetical protein